MFKRATRKGRYSLALEAKKELPHPPVGTRAAAVVTCNGIKPAVTGPCLVTSRAARQEA